MTTSTAAANLATPTAAPSTRLPWIMLFGRSALFLALQALLALGFSLSGAAAPWDTAARWWPLFVFIANLICLAVLIVLFRREGLNYWHIFKIERKNFKSDLLALLPLLLLGGPLGFFPTQIIGAWLFGNPQIPLDLLVQPLPVWGALVALILFPLTQGLVEIPLYMLYVAPRLERAGLPTWLAVLIAGLGLSTQHVFVPLLFNLPFIIYRLTIFLLFALFVAILMRWRPSLMPYVAAVHILMDVSIGIFFVQVML